MDRARLGTKEQEERRGRGNLIDWLSILGSIYSGRFFEILAVFTYTGIAHFY